MCGSVMLPDTDDLTFCRDLRAKSNLPVIMLTARGEETDRFVVIEMGADDAGGSVFVAKSTRIEGIVQAIRPAVQTRLAQY